MALSYFSPGGSNFYQSIPPTIGKFSGGQVLSFATDGTYLYVGGTFTSYQDKLGVTTTCNRLAKLVLATGQYESGFNTSTGANAQILTIVIVGGYIYIGGSFTSVNGVTRQGLAKLNASTAVVDTTFDTASGVTGSSATVTCMFTTGTYFYVGGFFTSFKGNARNNTVLVDATTGAYTASWYANCSAGVRNFTFDGSVYLCGDFTTVNGTTRQRIAKVNGVTGATDATFNSASGANGIVTAATHDGTNLYFTGNFSTYKGVTRNGVAKCLLTTAANDTGFAPTGMLGGAKIGYWIVLESTNLYLGGNWTTSFNGNASFLHVVKISSTTGAIDTSFIPSPNNTLTQGIISGSTLILGYDGSVWYGTAVQGYLKANLTTGALV